MSKDKKISTEKPKRSADELRELHAAKIEHAVLNIEKWTEKLGKAMTARKYPMTEAQTAQVLAYLEKVNQSFIDRLSGPEKSAKPSFQLSR